VTAGEFRGLYVASDAIDPWIAVPESDALKAKLDFLVVQDTTITPLAHLADVVLAAATFAEKAGSYVNASGRLQYSEAALPPRDGSLPDLDLLAILLNRPGGPVKSSEVLAEMAETIPAFAAAKGGILPPYGVVLGAEAPESGPATPPSFTDTWFLAHGEARAR
jgi:predicted molibdopterin-dependent oxidoreductase YjgC